MLMCSYAFHDMEQQKDITGSWLLCEFVIYPLRRWDESEYMKMHTFELQKKAPSWLDSSIGRALHRYRRGHGFDPVQAWIFFRLSFRNCLSCVWVSGTHFYNKLEREDVQSGKIKKREGNENRNEQRSRRNRGTKLPKTNLIWTRDAA